MTQRLVVVGGDAAGMSAASQARRLQPAERLEIIAFERSSWVSYSACGEPYYVAGLVEPIERLVARTPERFAADDIAVRTRHEVMAIDLDRRVVQVTDLDGGNSAEYGFDLLMIATGATAERPQIDGRHLPEVQELRTLDDALRLRTLAEQRQGRVTVVGGGYIGLETAEAFKHQGWEVHVVTSGRSVLEKTLDTDMGDSVVKAMEHIGIEVTTGTRVTCIAGDGRVEAVGVGDDLAPTDLVVLGLGSRPEVDLSRDAGVPLGETGAIAVDDRQRTTIDGVYSAGDCAEALHRVTGRPCNLHLGTIANKAGRVAGFTIGGGDKRFPGVLGTAITKICGIEVASTGLRPAEALEAGFDPVVGDAEGTTTAGYWPGASPLKIRAVSDRSSGRLLGAQIVGGSGGAKRIDVFATAIWNGMTAEELAWTDLAYAPPFSGVWDLIHIAARRAAS